MKKHHFLAFDLGATSGRSVLGTLQSGIVEIKELTRFPNSILQVRDKFYWNIFTLYEALKDGLCAAAREGVEIDGIGIDTWGVDFVYLGEDGSILGLPRSYRDPYTNGVPEAFFEVIPKKEVYDLTGIQIMNFNSLYQLFAADKEGSSALKASEGILFMPDALAYLLTGNKVCEYTIASTSQILNPRTRKFEKRLLEAAGVDPSLMPPVVMPGEIVGYLSDELAKECGLPKVPVIAVAGHDTASAVAAVPAENEKFAYLSSGTWSLMGIEVTEPIITEDSFRMNFTNEGGVGGTTRFLKNLTGMWLLEQCRKEWSRAGRDYSYPEIVGMAEAVQPFRSWVDCDDPSFANPESMTKAITDYCVSTGQKVPETDGEIVRCIFESLALKYKYVLECLKKMAPFPIERLHIIGGGAQNRLLNRFAANAIGIPVVAGPFEATAFGNIMMQAQAIGPIQNLQEMRNVIRASVTPEIFIPEDSACWEDAFSRFEKILKKN